MKAEDTVMRNMEIQHAIYNAQPKRLIDNFLLDEYLLQFQAVAKAQAEISFKAGAGEKEKAKERALEAGKVLGRREVVEWIEQDCGYDGSHWRHIVDAEWQAQKKKWGIK